MTESRPRTAATASAVTPAQRKIVAEALMGGGCRTEIVSKQEMRRRRAGLHPVPPRAGLAQRKAGGYPLDLARARARALRIRID